MKRREFIAAGLGFTLGARLAVAAPKKGPGTAESLDVEVWQGLRRQLFGERAILPYRAAFVLAIYLGATWSLRLVWNIADVMNGLMALPNLVGLLLLSRTIAADSRDYFSVVRPGP